MRDGGICATRFSIFRLILFGYFLALYNGVIELKMAYCERKPAAFSFIDSPRMHTSVDSFHLFQSSLVVDSELSADQVVSMKVPLVSDLVVVSSPQEPVVTAEDDDGSDNSQFTGSTINLQDLE